MLAMACQPHSKQPPPVVEVEPLPMIHELKLKRQRAAARETVELYSLAFETVEGRFVAHGPVSPYAIVCDEALPSPCSGLVQYYPVALRGKLRRATRDDPDYSLEGTTYALDECRCRPAPEHWERPSARSIERIKYDLWDLHYADTVARRHRLPLEVVNQIAAGWPAAWLHP